MVEQGAEQSVTKRRRRPSFAVVLVSIVVVASAGGFLASRFVAGRNSDFPDVLAPIQIKAQKHREKSWSRAQWISASVEPARLAEAWKDSLHDVDGLIDADQAQSLFAAAAPFAHAYSRDTASAYVDLVEATDWLRWRPDPKVLHFYMAYYFGNDYPLTDDLSARDQLVALWPEFMVNHGFGWASVGVGLEGAYFSIKKRYSPTIGNGLSGLTEEEYDHWDGVPMHGYFHNYTWSKAEMTDAQGSREMIASYLKRDGVATVAYGHVLVKMRSGAPFVWQSRWIWDQESHEWVCDEMVMGIGRDVSTLF